MEDIDLYSENVIEVLETNYEGRTINHEGLKIGQKVKLVNKPYNEVFVVTLDNKVLGRFPGDYAAKYAPLIDDKKYIIYSEVVYTQYNVTRPVLTISVRVSADSLNEEQMEHKLVDCVQKYVDTYEKYLDDFHNYIDADNFEESEVIRTFLKLRYYKKIVKISHTIILENNIRRSDKSNDNDYNYVLVSEDINKIAETTKKLLKENQLQFNAIYNNEDVDNSDDELERVQKIMAEKKRLKKIQEYCQAVLDVKEELFEEKFESKSTDEIKQPDKPELNVEPEENKEEPNEEINIPEIIEKSNTDEVNKTVETSQVPVNINRINLDDISSYTGTKPVSLKIYGKPYSVKNWKDVYKDVICFIYDSNDSYREKLLSYRGRSLSGKVGSRFDFADERTMRKLIAPHVIKRDFYVETNLSATDIIRRINRLIEIFKLDKSQIDIRYRYVKTDRSLSRNALQVNGTENFESGNNQNADEVNVDFKSEREEEKVSEIKVEKSADTKVTDNEDKQIENTKDSEAVIKAEQPTDLAEKIGLILLSKDSKVEEMRVNGGLDGDAISKLIKHYFSEEIKSQRISLEIFKSIHKNRNEFYNNNNFFQITDEYAEILRKKGFSLEKSSDEGTEHGEDKEKSYQPEKEDLIEENNPIDETTEDTYSDNNESSDFFQNEQKEESYYPETESYRKFSSELSRSISENQDIKIILNKKEYDFFDYNDALAEVCEFAIRRYPFKMSRIANEKYRCSDKNVFSRGAAISGYRKLSNGLQVMPVEKINDLEDICKTVLIYCGANEDLFKIVNK